MDERAGRTTLWDVKRRRARRAVQKAALDLVERQGYQATTIEQICEAAEVSRSSFFRYFGSKEAAVRADLVAEKFESQAEGLRPASMAELAELICAAYEDLDQDEYEQELRRLQLVQRVPELQAGFADEIVRPYLLLVEYVALIRDAPTSSVAVHAEAGAMWGAIAALWLPFGRIGGPGGGPLSFPATPGEAAARMRAAFAEVEAMLGRP